MLLLPVAVLCVCQAVSQEEREAELVRRVREAVSLGLGVLDADFERLDVDVANSDSDDDDASAANTKTPVMFERKVTIKFDVTHSMTIYHSLMFFWRVCYWKRKHCLIFMSERWIWLFNLADCTVAGMGRAFSRVCPFVYLSVCLFVCTLRGKRLEYQHQT